MRYVALFTGVFLLVICIALPIPGLDYTSPFTSDMLRHAGLLLLAAPLIAMALPPAGRMRRSLTALSRVTARRPVVAWLAGVSTMWFWHIPSLYNALHGSGQYVLSCAPGSLFGKAPASGLHSHVSALCLLHDPSLVIAGFLFCWPLVTPYPSLRLPVLHGILYLASACVTCSLMGLFITYAPPGAFRGVAIDDQQTGGLIMWVPCCFLYLSASMWLLVRWLYRQEGKPLIHSESVHS
jgi:cytochrome c oxidase assembly factor CtaG